MAKAAFATWNERIAPVFDVARLIHLVEIEAGRVVNQRQVGITGDMANLKAACLAEMGVSTLVCGAISRPVQEMVSAYGIQVIAFVAGNLEEIIQAWASGKLVGSDAFAMPGCRKARRSQGPGHSNPEETRMRGKKGKEKGAGRGAGGGQGGKGQGSGQSRGRAAQAAGQGPGPAVKQDVCICSLCGHEEPHERGIPCTRSKCPKCGGTMVRK